MNLIILLKIPLDFIKSKSIFLQYIRSLIINRIMHILLLNKFNFCFISESGNIRDMCIYRSFKEISWIGL